MLKLIQKVITTKDILGFNDYTDWSDNILPQGTVGYEITIGSVANNQFVIDNAVNSPFIIQTQKMNESNIEIPLPLAIHSHIKPIKSLRIHKDNKYDSATVINILVSADEKNLDQWLDEVSILSGNLEELKAKVELMYGTAFGIEDYNLGDRLLFLENLIDLKTWEDNLSGFSISSIIGDWQYTNSISEKIEDVTNILAWDDTYLS